MKIGFMGDTHANYAAARFMLWSLKQKGVERVIQVGDFGIYTDDKGMKFANKVNEAAARLGLIIWVVPGNHENWRVINELVGEERTKAAIYRSNIWILPRGFRWEWGGMSFVALGGAPSVDRMTRKSWDSQHKGKRANMYWYAEEQITGYDVDYVASGGYADVMVAHDAPHGISTIEQNIGGNPFGFHIADLLYAEDGRKLMTEAFRAVSPRYFFHGHYHFPVSETVRGPLGECLVTGLDCEFSNGSMAVLDTETGVVDNIDHTTLLFQYRKDGAAW